MIVCSVSNNKSDLNFVDSVLILFCMHKNQNIVFHSINKPQNADLDIKITATISI